MKNCLIAFLIVTAIFLGSLNYKSKKSQILDHFPINKFQIECENPRIYLIFFFSIDNCFPCLRIIETLNNLPSQYKVIGLVPEREINFEDEVRKITNARFELKSYKGLKTFKPNYSPSLYGVSQRGEILFILPGVPGQDEYLKQFLESFLHRASLLLKNS